VVRNDGREFPSLTAAAKAVGSSAANVLRVCNGLSRTVKGWSFRYKDFVE